MQLKDELKRQWETMADFWIKKVGQGQEVHRVGLLDDCMVEVRGDVPVKDIIDLGCGEGRFSRMMAKSGASASLPPTRA